MAVFEILFKLVETAKSITERFSDHKIKSNERSAGYLRRLAQNLTDLAKALEIW